MSTMLPSPPPPPEETLPLQRQPQTQQQSGMVSADVAAYYATGQNQWTPPPQQQQPPPASAQPTIPSPSQSNPLQSSFWSNPLGGISSGLQTLGKDIAGGASQAAGFIANAGQGWQDISSSLWNSAQNLEASGSPAAKVAAPIVAAGAEAAEIPAGLIGSVQSIWNPNTPDFLSMGINYGASAVGLGGRQAAQQQRQFLMNPRNIGYDIGDIGGQVLIAWATGEALSAAGRGLESVAEGESRFAPVAEKVLNVGKATNRVLTAPFRLAGRAGEAIGEKLGFSPEEFLRTHFFPDQTYGLKVTEVTRTEIEEGGRSAYQDLFTVERGQKISPELRDLLSLGKPVGVYGTVTEESTSLASLGEHLPEFQEAGVRAEQVLTKINIETEVADSSVNKANSLFKEGEAAAKDLSSSFEKASASQLVEPASEVAPYETILEQRNLSLALGKEMGTGFFGDIETAEQGVLEFGKNRIMEFRATGLGSSSSSDLGRITQTFLEARGIQMEFDEKALEEAGYSAEDLEKLLPKEEQQAEKAQSFLKRPAKIPKTNPAWGRPITEPGEIPNIDWRNFTGEQGTGRTVENPVTKGLSQAQAEEEEAQSVSKTFSQIPYKGGRSISIDTGETEQILRYPEGKAPLSAKSEFIGFETVGSRGLEDLSSGFGFGILPRLSQDLTLKNVRTPQTRPILSTTPSTRTQGRTRLIPEDTTSTRQVFHLTPKVTLKEIPKVVPVTVPTVVPLESESWPPKEEIGPNWPGAAFPPFGAPLLMGPGGGLASAKGSFYRELEHGINTNPFAGFSSMAKKGGAKRRSK
jgi:hypothetical protein